MKKTVLICGLIAGFISASLFIGLMIVGDDGKHSEDGMLIGYTLMILAFSFIFVGTKITRDKHQGGVISFGKAFRVGLYITLIASTIYVVMWLFTYYLVMPDFAEHYSAQMLEKMKASGASAAELAREQAEMARFNQMYKNPFFNAMITYTEILPVGLLMSLISALILKKKPLPGLQTTEA